LTLRFSVRVQGETSFDFLRVYNSTTTTTFAAGTPLTGQLAQYSILAGYQQQTITINLTPSNSSQTRRIAFGWINDGSLGTPPPASVDNISLTYDLPLELTYTGLTQSTFKAVMNGSFQAVSAITSVGVQISKNNATASNISEQSFNISANYKDSFGIQNSFTLSNGDTVSPLINNKSSAVAITVNDLFLSLIQID